MIMRRLALLLLILTLLLVWCALTLHAATPADAVIQMPSHGGSATVIQTGQGRSVLLSCGHCFEGGDRNKKLTLNLPSPNPSEPIRAAIRCVAVDYRADLSLITVAHGPLPYCVPVSPTGKPAGKVVAAGYDRMQLSTAFTAGTVVEVHILSTNGDITFTRERPVPGRSGGALLDWDGCQLIGVCQGHEALGRGRGMYISCAEINRFLQRNAQYLIPPGEQVAPIRRAPNGMDSVAQVAPVMPIRSVAWRPDYNTARVESARRGVPLMVNVGCDNCLWCGRLDQSLADPWVAQTINGRYVPVRINGTRQPQLAAAMGVRSYPSLVFVGSDGRVIRVVTGYQTVAQLRALLGVVAVPQPLIMPPVAQAPQYPDPWGRPELTLPTVPYSPRQPIYYPTPHDQGC